MIKAHIKKQNGRLILLHERQKGAMYARAHGEVVHLVVLASATTYTIVRGAESPESALRV